MTEAIAWWLDLTLRHGPGGLVIGGLVVAVALIAVLAILTALLHVIGAFKEGFAKGWDRPVKPGSHRPAAPFAAQRTGQLPGSPIE